MTAPDPWPNGTHLVVRGRIVVVVDHAPNADAWHYHGTPSDLAGDVITFSHSEATPVTRPITPRPVGSVLPDVARDLMARAVPMDVFDQELAMVESEEDESPLAELLRAIGSSFRAGLLDANLHQTYIQFREAGT